MPESINKKLSHVEFINREYNISHLDYNKENAFFNALRIGDAEGVRRLFKPFGGQEMGQLSPDPVRNLKYHFIITVAFMTRASIEGGMEMETAYNLSDVYIREIDKCTSEEQVNLLHREAVEDYAQRMEMISRANRYPRSITLALDYIYDNLHTRITLERLAEEAGLSTTYFSKLFKSEVGMTVPQYIASKRIEAAGNMLRFTDRSVLEISEYLCFSSESYFISVFRRYTGMTPKEYRERFFRMKTRKSENQNK